MAVEAKYSTPVRLRSGVVVVLGGVTRDVIRGLVL